MATIYLNAGYDGTIYESSKVAKEGFDPHVSATTGNTTYRKVYKKGLFGFYQGVELRDSKIGQQLSIHLIDGENNAIYFQIPFKNQKSGIGTFAESLIEKLPFLQVGTLYRFFAYNMPVEGTVYKNIGISVKFASDWENAMEDPKVGKLSRSYTTTEGVSVQGDIPAIIWRENFDKTTTADSSAKDTYLYNVLCQYGKVPTATPVATPQAQPAPNGTTGVPVQQPIVQQQSALSPNTGFHQPSPQFNNLFNNLFSNNLFSNNLFSNNLFSNNLFSNNLFSNNLFSNNLFSNNLFSNNLFSNNLFSNNLFSNNLFSNNLFSNNLFSNNLFSNNLFSNLVCNTCHLLLLAQQTMICLSRI
jgi:hypothetical protein